MNHATPHFRLSLLASLTLALLSACAGIDEQPDAGPIDPEPQTKTLDVACETSFAGEGPVTFGWELTLDPTTIVGGEDFAADVEGKAMFDEANLNVAQTLVEGGFKDAMLVGLQATVHVRNGATGDDVVLTPGPIPYLCAVDKAPCDPENDLPGTPGIRGNTDCEPQGAINPCGRFIELTTNDNCDPGGPCDESGNTGDGSPCELNGFCVSGPVTVPLEQDLEAYQADAFGNVLFGFDDQNTEVLQEGGCNDGTWIIPDPSFDDPLGPNGARLILGGIPVALECVMGVISRGPFGVDSCDPLASPTPDSLLISFPIQVP